MAQAVTGNKVSRGWRWATSPDGWPAVFTIGLVLLGLGLGVAVWLGVAAVPRSPTAVVQAFYEAIGSDDLDEARQFLSNDARTRLDAMTAADQAAFVARLSNDHTLTEVLPLGVRNYGSRAVASVLITADSGPGVRTDEVIREGRAWRITWPIGERHWNDLVEPYDRFSVR